MMTDMDDENMNDENMDDEDMVAEEQSIDRCFDGLGTAGTAWFS